MKIRGYRECRECGHRWSYYDTGSVACPDCGSLRSVGIDDRKRHTDAPSALDLSDHRNAVDEGSVAAVADDLKRDLREYVRRRGFIRGGDLLDLDDTYLAAHELLHAVDVYVRTRDPTDDERLYVLSLLRNVDAGERPAKDDAPASMAAARGLAYANAVEAYRRDVGTWLDDNPDSEARRTLESLEDRIKRAKALRGDVPLGESEALVRVTKDLAAYLREGDESALVTARDRLARMG
ncbi:DUF7117 family protein [Halegenticoccus tardaugens]|uniref:DUF7117 family protein n=1 Tax=Halegenticoccus tardaugens TaxID=2071624 RepID=UPI00100AF024|nr:zinc ribbon domain-containing protein [Halegenticoccus tardaugens]